MLDTNNVVPAEQKDCLKGSFGFKDQLLENNHSNQINLITAYIDYEKAFKSAPHSWILKVLELYKTLAATFNFLKICMKEWKTNLHLNHTQINTTCENLKIKYGIFQSLCFSPFLFCLSSFFALVHFSYNLNRTGYGYHIYKSRINHLFFTWMV